MVFARRSFKARVAKALKKLCCCCISEKDSLEDSVEDNQTSSATTASAMLTSENCAFASDPEEQRNPDLEVGYENEEFHSEITANKLIMKTPENCAFASDPEDQISLDVEACYEKEEVNSETTNAENILMDFEEILEGLTHSFVEEDSVQIETITEEEGLDEFSETITESERSSCFKAEEIHVEFSVGVKVTTEQEHFSSKSRASMTSSGEPNQTYCCNHEVSAKDKTDTKYKQISHEAYQVPLQYIMITEDELSACFEDEIQNDTDYFCGGEDNRSQTDSNLDPTVYFSKFSNSFNNSWMNAAMQSILNLSITRRFVAEYPEEVFGALKGTPLCAKLFGKAMQYPGTYFSPEEMHQVLIEINKSVALTASPHHNELTNFLNAILRWFNPCGMNTVCVVKTAAFCDACQETSLGIWEIGPIVCLPYPLPYDSTTSLLNRWASETFPDDCAACYSDLKRKYFLNDTDVIALYLPRSDSQWDLRHPVIPSATIDIPVKTGTQIYHLSSVICHQTRSCQTDHFYSYLMCGQLVYKAEDDQVTTSNIDCAADICYNGYIYIYEKCIEELDEFSVGVKVTTDQENVNSGSTANMPTMTRLVGDLKSLTYLDFHVDETITDSELSSCFKAEETHVEGRAIMTSSVESNQTYCCNHEVSAKDKTDTKYKQISHEAYQVPLQYIMITEDELSACFEDEIQNDTDYFCGGEDNRSQTNSNLDPTVYFSKFSNSFNNSWMNAAMQSILNLSITRRFVAEYPEEVFGALKGTPLCANLFGKAMQYPGTYFSPEEMHHVLIEINKSVALTALPDHNELTNFLNAILRWFNPCGMNTVCVVKTAAFCDACQETSLGIWEIGPIVCLPYPLPYDSTTSLLNRWASETFPDDCAACYSDLKRKCFLNDTDVIALYLPRSDSQGDLRHPVIPSATIDIPVKTGTQIYRLSSVICHQTRSCQTDHFYSYLMCGQLVYKAEDDQVTTSNIDCAADICYNGYIYIYEKCIEELDEFSVGVKVTTDQEHFSSKSTGNMTSSGEPNQTYCCNHEVSAKDKTDTKDEQITYETYQDPLQYVMITEDEVSACLEDEIQNDTDYCYGPENNRSQTNSDLDPTVYFCKFSNSFNNSWMNVTIQSILNLSITRRFADEYPEKVFGALSGTPMSASLLLTAIHHPGTYFTPEQIYQVLIEISESVPPLGLAQQNLTAAFLSAFLRWLNPCGINTVCMLNNIITCERCRVATPVMSELGTIIYLSDANPNDTTASLLHRFVLEDCYEKKCNICLSNIKRNIFFNDTDVITLHLERSPNQGDLGLPVIPSATIEIPLQNGAQLYRLSSVICCQTLGSQTDHFYTYLKSGQLVFLADDDQVTIAHSDSAKDLYQNGFMYMYEKYTEGAN